MNNDNVKVNIGNGKAVWTSKNWGEAGIYQAVKVKANEKYKIDFDVFWNGIKK